MSLSVNSISATIGKKVNNMATAIGNGYDKSKHKGSLSKAAKLLEPTGANNAFIPMASLMGFFTILPRVITACKRNPDDKEKTKDEIKEILFRDVTTVLTVLFALKSANSIIASMATKKTGLPMLNKPYKKIFDTKEKGLGKKATEFFNNPVEKIKRVATNIKDTLHPTGGVIALKNDQFKARYSNFNSTDEIIKLLDDIPAHGGDSKKVFNKIIDFLIDEQEELLNGNSKKGIMGLIKKAQKMTKKDGTISKASQKEIENAKNILSELKGLKDKDYNIINSDSTSEAVKNVIISFFQNEDNSLLRSAKGLNAFLRIGALTFEALFLGMGLPALNQRRLKKKYLKDNPNTEKLSENINKNNASSILLKNSIKTNGMKSFKGFMR